MMALVWAFVKPFLTPRNLAILGGAGALLALCLYMGHLKHEAAQARALAAQEAQEIANLRLMAKQTDATRVVDLKAAQAQAKIQADTTALLQKVPQYVSRKADDQCIVSRGAVQLLDAAATGSPVPSAPSGVQGPNPSVGDPDADSGVKLSGLVQADVVNAGSYRDVVARLQSWDAWYDAQKALAQPPQ